MTRYAAFFLLLLSVTPLWSTPFTLAQSSIPQGSLATALPPTAQKKRTHHTTYKTRRLISNLLLSLKENQALKAWPLRGEKELLIGFHQTILSEADGPRSHFRPSSSQYMAQTLQEWGAVEGLILGLERLLRENGEPWLYEKVHDQGLSLKYNPPPKRACLKQLQGRDDLLLHIFQKRVRINTP